jgi:type II secretion system protein C
MFQYLHLIIRSTFTRFNLSWVIAAIILVAVFLPTVSSAPPKLANFELSGVVMNNADSLAVLFDKQQHNELVLRVGDVVAGCVLDYVRRSRVSFYCNDQILTMTLRSLSIDITSTLGKDVWSPPVTISNEDRVELFDQPENFIITFNLVPHSQDGQLAAFEIKRATDGDITKTLDLQQGDLIVAVNGVAATNADEFSEAFEQIKFTQSIDIELIRDGVRYYKNYLLQR